MQTDAILFPANISNWPNIPSGHMALGIVNGALVLRSSAGVDTAAYETTILKTSGAYETTFKQGATTEVTLPTSNCVLARTDALQTFTGVQTFSAKPVLALGATITGGGDLVLSATTGTKIGTATTQLLGFWNTTPCDQPAGTVCPIVSLKEMGLIAAGTTPLTVPGAFTASGTSALNGHVTMGDGINIITNGTTGTKIGTATTQKIGFWNVTPIVQPSAIIDATDAASALTRVNAVLAQLRLLGLIAAS